MNFISKQISWKIYGDQISYINRIVIEYKLAKYRLSKYVFIIMNIDNMKIDSLIIDDAIMKINGKDDELFY